MDPFEVRMRFTSLLKHLNASLAAAQKAAQFALKHKDMHEDLHSCILEQLSENPNFNTRANIMCFIQVLIDAADREAQRDYIHMLERDMLQIVEWATANDGVSAINIPLCRKIVWTIHRKGFLPEENVDQVEALLSRREALAHERAAKRTTVVAEDLGPAAGPGPAVLVPPHVDKRQVEQRIEEDRERHKRLRENIWAVSEEDDIAKLWDHAADLDGDDLRMMEEEAEERIQNISVCPRHGRPSTRPPHPLNGQPEPGRASAAAAAASSRPAARQQAASMDTSLADVHAYPPPR